MARTFLTPIDLGQNELRNARVQNLGTPPASPVSGQIYYDSTLSAHYIYNGTAWVSSDASKLVAAIPNAALVTNPLARANHTGTQLSATISDFATTAQGYALNLFAAPAANIPMAGFTMTGLATPAAAGQAATFDWTKALPLNTFAVPTANIPFAGFKLTGLGAPSAAGDSAEYSWVVNQVQSAAAGIASKPPVRLVASANIGLTGLGAIDGITPVAGDRILATAQTLPAQNGVYVAAAGAWVRSSPTADAVDELETGSLWLATEGTAWAATQWRLTTTGAIVSGTTALTIVQFGAASVYTAANGITLTGGAFSVNPLAGGGLIVAPGGASVDGTVFAKKFSASIGDGASTSIVVTHALNTQDVIIFVRQATTPFSEIECDVSATSATTATIAFASAPTANQFRVTIMG